LCLLGVIAICSVASPPGVDYEVNGHWSAGVIYRSQHLALEPMHLKNGNLKGAMADSRL